MKWPFFFLLSSLSICETISNVIATQRHFWESLRLQPTHEDEESIDGSDAKIEAKLSPEVAFRCPDQPSVGPPFAIVDCYPAHTAERVEELGRELERLKEGKVCLLGFGT